MVKLCRYCQYHWCSGRKRMMFCLKETLLHQCNIIQLDINYISSMHQMWLLLPSWVYLMSIAVNVNSEHFLLFLFLLPCKSAAQTDKCISFQRSQSVAISVKCNADLKQTYLQVEYRFTSTLGICSFHMKIKL